MNIKPIASEGPCFLGFTGNSFDPLVKFLHMICRCEGFISDFVRNGETARFLSP
jgi:hypothetical protein